MAGTEKPNSYKDAGVDVVAGDELVDWLIEGDQTESRKRPHQEKIVSGIGGFASLFRANFSHMKSPCLVSSTDGVGTKVKIAADWDRYEGVGQDLVAMCVNDLACVGAEPLFFLDYYATGKLDLGAAKKFLAGVRKACAESGCALIGGETAEMPGVYQAKDFDCAGFVVGVVDEHETLGAHNVRAGDRMIGVESSGFHSNGYSLLRKVFANDMKNWVDVLLRPTHLYPQMMATLLKEHGAALHAAAHVTGGGLENLLRVVPKDCDLELKAWPVPEIFLEVKRRAQMSWPDILGTLNCGIGMVLTVAADEHKSILASVERCGFRGYDLGEVVQKTDPEREHQWRLNYSEMPSP